MSSSTNNNGVQCPNCDSINLSKKWSWCRTRDVVVGYPDSGIERKQFLSRNTRYLCCDCRFSFMKVTKLFPSEESTSELTAKIKRSF